MLKHGMLVGLLLLAAGSGACSHRDQPASAAAEDVSQNDAPNARHWVTDRANMLSVAQEDALARKLESLEHRTHHQMVIVTVPSLDGRDIQAYTRDLANSWGVGRRGVDDGVMILLAPNDRKIRIEVGRGLQDRLPDELCRSVAKLTMLPNFRKGDYYAGLEAGTDLLIKHLG